MKNLVQTYQKIITGKNKSWVLFENATCVILMKPAKNLEEQAIKLLKKFGPVHAGSSSGDFQVIKLADDEGWVVGCHHPDILTYVSLEHLSKSPSDLEIGMEGRSKRNSDAKNLKVIHVEDQRA